jgi:hypothetical protein
VGLRVPASFECVLDETGNVVLVFDDENAMSDHDLERSLPVRDIGRVSKVLIVS